MSFTLKMGRDFEPHRLGEATSLDMYIVSKNFQHDTTKRFCFGWDFQDDLDKMEVEMQKGGCDCWDSPDWCPVCHMFEGGVYDQTGIVLDHFNISRSYGDPMWSSEWSVDSLYLGGEDTPFTRLFRSRYSEIVKPSQEIQRLQKEIEELGTPRRESDIEAYELTNEVLSFLKKWAEHPDIRVVYESS